MALFNSAASLLFTVKTDTDEARRDFKKLKNEIKDTTDEAGGAGASSLMRLGQAAGLTSSQMGSLAAAAPIAGAAIVALAGAVAAGVGALFQLSKQASEYGSAIFDASEKTGLGAESISALKFAAEQSGSSFEKITGSVAKFNVLLGEANEGSEKARKTLEKYGITARDTDGALQQAITTIAAMASADQKAAAAKALFKDRTAEILPVIKSFDGDLPGLIDKLREMGLLMSDKNAKAADVFGDQMDLLNKQLTGVGYTIGFEVMPVFLELATSLSEWLKRNPGEIKFWAGAFKAALVGTVIEIKAIVLWVQTVTDSFATLLNIAGVIQQLGVQSGAAVSALFDASMKRQSDRLAQFSSLYDQVKNYGQPGPQSSALGGSSRRSNISDTADEEGKKEAEKRAKEREQLAKRDADAQIKILDNQLDEALKSYDVFFEKLGERAKNGEDLAALKLAADVFVNTSNTEFQKILEARNDAENKQISLAKKTSAELQLIQQERDQRVADIDKQRNEARDKYNENLKNIEKKSAEDRLKNIRETTDAEISARERASATVLARYEKDAAIGKMTEGDLIRNRTILEADFLKFKLEKLQQNLAAVKGNAEEEKRINTEIAETREKQEQNRIKGEKDIFLLQKANAIELLNLRREVAAEEARILDFRKEQERKGLQNLADSARGANRIEALKVLRDFDIAEEQRLKDRRDADIEAEKNASLEKIKGKENEEEQKFQIEELYRKRRLMSEAEFQAALKEITDRAKKAIDDAGGEGIFDSWTRSWKSFFDQMALDLSGSESLFQIFGQVVGAMAGTLQRAYVGVAQAIGSVIQQWVLYGKTGPAIMRQILASALATIAAEAAVRAIFELGAGFASLFVNPAEAAAHFTAAALFGSIAVGAALAGRAIAGKSFTNQQAGQKASSGTGTGGFGSDTGQNSNTANQGKQFSSFGDNVTIIDTSRNAPQNGFMQTDIHIKLEMDSDGVVKVIERNVKTNGSLRSLIIDTAAS